jgi:hypothetical protein
MRQLNDNRTGQLAMPVPQLAGLVGVPASIPLHLIDAEDQVRTTSGIDESLDELAESIKSRGVLQPSLPSSAPTSKPSGCRCSSFVFGTSSATLRLLTQISVCCIDQLNPPPEAGARGCPL